VGTRKRHGITRRPSMLWKHHSARPEGVAEKVGSIPARSICVSSFLSLRKGHITVSMFKKAVRHQLKGRIAIDGPSGSGKTFTALRLATALADGGRIAVINTESGAIQKYLGLAPDGTAWDFDVCELSSYSPSAYTEAIVEAGKAGYAVLLIDSLSHAWEGEGGALEQVTKASDRSKNSFTAWKDVTPQHNRMIGAILKSPCHIIATMRSKTEYVLETNNQGKSVPRKVGMAPVQRAGMEYEFDLYCSMDWDHVMRVSKSRCPEMDDLLAVKPSLNTFMPFAKWLAEGTPAPEGYYSAKEQDFRKLEESQVAAVNAKPMSAMEKAKELAEAKAAAQRLRESQQATEVKPAVAETTIDDGEPASMDGKITAYTNEPCTVEEVAAIKAAASEAKQTGVLDIADRITKKLASLGKSKLSELSSHEASLFLNAIQKRNLEAFFDLNLAGLAAINDSDIPF
jgi:ABC-type dipeptide/oligopeptide/nickel transport system ATPase component